MFHYFGEGSLNWITDPFTPYDYEELSTWIETWPEAQVIIAGRGMVQIMPSDAIYEMGSYNGDYIIDLPTYRVDPDVKYDPIDDDYIDGAVYEERATDWYVPEGGNPATDFLHELSWRVQEHSTCVLRMGGSDYDTIIGHAYGIVGGEAPPEERIVELSLDEIYSKAANLEGSTLMIGYNQDQMYPEEQYHAAE